MSHRKSRQGGLGCFEYWVEQRLVLGQKGRFRPPRDQPMETIRSVLDEVFEVFVPRTSLPVRVDPTGLFSLTMIVISTHISLSRFTEEVALPTPDTVAFNSGAGIRSNTPALRSPSANKLANSTARCCSSSSIFVVYDARMAAMRSCCAALVVGLAEILVIAAKVN